MTFQEVAEDFLRNLILRDEFHYIILFFKQINHMIRILWSFHDIEDFKASLSQLDYRCPVTDPSSIIDHYLDPSLGAGQHTPGKVLFQYLDGIPKYVSILKKKKDFDNILNN